MALFLVGAIAGVVCGAVAALWFADRNFDRLIEGMRP